MCFEFFRKERWAVEDKFFFFFFLNTKMVIFNGVHQHSGNKCLGALTEPVSKLSISAFKYLIILSFVLVFCHFITIAKTEELIWPSRGEELRFITVKYHHLSSTEVKEGDRYFFLHLYHTGPRAEELYFETIKTINCVYVCLLLSFVNDQLM